MRRPLPFAILVLTGIVVDLVSKSVIFNALEEKGSIALVPGVLNLTLAKNYGVAFSIMRGYPSEIFIVVSVLSIAAFIWLYMHVRSTAHPLMLIAIGMLLCGAAGNMVDRAFFGFVRDFIDFVPNIPMVGRWAVFNVADICITVGVVLYLIAEIFLRKTPAPAEVPAAEKQRPEIP